MDGPAPMRMLTALSGLNGFKKEDIEAGRKISGGGITGELGGRKWGGLD